MTARQVIEEIKAMTPEERGQVVEYVRQLEGVRKVDDRVAEELSDRILDKHADLMRKLAS